MAWTTDKNALLYQMLKERFSVEGNLSEFNGWNLTRSWTTIINKYVSDISKQSILNDLIDDKIIYIDKSIVSTTSTGSSLTAQKANLLLNKE